MNQGDWTFYLREIHGRWAPSNVSSEKLAWLENEKLIEIQPGDYPLVRLTAAGQQRKMAARSHYQTSIPTSRPQPSRAPQRSRPRRPRAKATLPRPLV